MLSVLVLEINLIRNGPYSFMIHVLHELRSMAMQDISQVVAAICDSGAGNVQETSKMMERRCW